MFDQLSVPDLVSMASEQPMLGVDEEDGLIRRIQSGDTDAVEALVLGTLRIAVDEAIRIRGLGLPQRELVRLAVRTLVESALSYDSLGDGSFSTHARSNVRRALIRGLSAS